MTQTSHINDSHEKEKEGRGIREEEEEEKREVWRMRTREEEWVGERKKYGN